MIRIRNEEVLRYIGQKGTPAAEVQALIDRAANALFTAADPRHTVLRLPIAVADEEVSFNSLSIQSPGLCAHLAGCREAVLFAATLGAQVDRLMARHSHGDMSYAYAIQACAASAIECYCDDWQEAFQKALTQEGLYLKPRFSPGYGGFDIRYQEPILRMLQADKRIGLGTTASHMLTPLKSVTAIVGITSVPQLCSEHKCARCGNLNCPFRKE